MPSTDIDGSIIVILSEVEARRVYEMLHCLANKTWLVPLERKLADKIARDLNLEKL